MVSLWYQYISFYTFQSFINVCFFTEIFFKIFFLSCLAFFPFCSFSFLPHFLFCANITFLLWETSVSLPHHATKPEGKDPIVQLLDWGTNEKCSLGASRWVGRNHIYLVYSVPFVPCLIILPKGSKGLITETWQPCCYFLGNKTPEILWGKKSFNEISYKTKNGLDAAWTAAQVLPGCRPSRCTLSVTFILTDPCMISKMSFLCMHTHVHIADGKPKHW